MGRLNLEEIEPGMTLASDVLDRSGRVLLKSGLQVTEKHLTILKQWGITDADILGVNRDEINAKAIENFDRGLLTICEEEQRLVFSQVDMSLPFNQELFRLSVIRSVKRKAGAIANDN